jgi:hypothetical protein
LFDELEYALKLTYQGEVHYATDGKRKIHEIDMFLLWIVRSDSNDASLISFLFNNIHRTTVDRIADHVTRAALVSWPLEAPTAEERKSNHGLFSSAPTAVAALDGTHCRIRVPFDDSNAHFSSYKKYHTQNFLIAVDAFGFIVYVDGPHPGRNNDRHAFNNSHFITSVGELLSEDECILVDGGFRGSGQILHQYTEPELRAAKSKDELLFMKKFNEEFTLNRTSIEHTIHKVKSRIGWLSERFPRSKEKQADLFYAGARLCNRIRMIRFLFALKEHTELVTTRQKFLLLHGYSICKIDTVNA